MTVSRIYDIALYLAEKTDDNTGYIDRGYKAQHKMKAFELIKQAISRIMNVLDMPVVNIDGLTFDSHINLPHFLTYTVIPCYVGAILCEQDGESEKYNVLIHEYSNALSSFKYDEEQVLDVYNILDGMED